MNPIGRSLLLTALLALVLPAGAPARSAGVTGTLVETHGDRLNGTISDRSYEIDARDGTRALSDTQPQALVGQRVHLDDSGRSRDGLRGRVRAVGRQRLAAAVAPGPRSLLAILLTTPDEPTPSATVDEARDVIFTGADSANAFYMQQSANATRFIGHVRADGDIAGPLSIGIKMAGCDTDALADAADQAAQAAGWAVDSYDHVAYLMPHSYDCDFGGLGLLPGRRLWSNGEVTTRVIAHELGHNLGAHHANTYRCEDGDGNPVFLSSSCATDEYGDSFDAMGLTPRLMSSWHRAQIGELPSGQTLSLRQSQTVTLVSSDDFSAAGTRLLLIPLKEPRVRVTQWLAVERRSELGPFDLWGTASPVASGLSVRRVPALDVSDRTQLLDATPTTNSFDDAPLQPGLVASDPAHGIAIRLDSIAGTSASVAVTMPTLVDDVPPSAPTNVAASGNTNAVKLRWDAADDDEAIGQYEVQRGGVTIGSTTALTFDDARVDALTTATYTVTAVDTSSNRTVSSPVTITLADVTVPSAVPGVSATVGGETVRVGWSPAQDNRAVARYRVLRDGATIATVTDLSHSEQPAPGRHVYAVRAIDTSDNVGPQTDAAPVTVAAPTPPPPPPGTSSGSPGSSPGSSGSSSGRRPQIRLVSRTRRGRIVTLRFSAAGARTMSAFRGTRRVARASASRLTVRLKIPRGVKRPRVKVVATSSAGSATRFYVLAR